MTASDLAAKDLRIVDLGRGMSASLVAKHFAELGAQVTRVAPEGGDPFDTLYPAHRLWRRGERVASRADMAALLERADVCILGGEDFPGSADDPDADVLSRRHPRLIVLRIVGDPRQRSEPAVDLLVQARTGVVYEQFSDRPIPAAFPLCSYGAALQGLIGAWIALIERERSGRGQVVEASLAAGAAMFWGAFWMKAARPDPGFVGITPRDVRQLILGCKGDEYLQMTLGVPGALAKVYGALGIPDPVDPKDRGMPDPTRGPANFYGNFDLFNAYARRHSRDDLLRALRAAGIPSEPVLLPGQSWDDEQTRRNGIIETDESGWSWVGNPLHFSLDGAPAPLPARLRAREPAAAPLAGVRIIDFGIFVAGPYASKILADYGADVIRVEPPTGRATMSGERTIISANHGKRSICIDIKAPEGYRIATKLCEGADIVMHNFRPGVADRLGLGQKALREINPGLVTLETTAYGAVGPKAGAPGFDMVIQAFCGLQHRAGGTGNPPLCCRTPLVDFAAGAVGAVGLLVGLYERLKSGRGVAVETNLLNVGCHMMSELVQGPDGTLHGAPALDSARSGVHPAESLYQTRDGWIAIAARSDAMAASLARVLGLSLPSRGVWRSEERDHLAAQIATWTTASLLSALEAAGVWAAPCLRDAWDQGPPDGHILRALNDAVYGEVVHCVGPLISFSRSAGKIAHRLSIEAGEDSAAILAELGIAEAQARAWFDAGIIANLCRQSA